MFYQLSCIFLPSNWPLLHSFLRGFLIPSLTRSYLVMMSLHHHQIDPDLPQTKTNPNHHKYTIMTSESKIKMKLLVDTNKHKLLFAEAGKDCIDFLFHILSLPLATIIGFLTTESIPSGISSLYKSLENLNTDYLQEGVNKDCLLNPKPTPGTSSNIPLLTIDNPIGDQPSSPSKTLYICAGTNYGSHYNSVHPYVSFTKGTTCPGCKVRKMNEGLTVVVPAGEMEKAVGGEGYVKGVVTYMIMDDLSVQPMSMVSSIALLNKFNVQDVACLEEREVTVDMNLGLALLKASLMSNTVLTDVFVVKKLDID